MEVNVLNTSATVMVREKFLFECPEHPDIKQILMVNRKPYGGVKHLKLKECIVPDFLNLDEVTAELIGYNACFYGAGISSLGMNEEEYSRITYDTTLYVANKLVSLNPAMVFDYVSGCLTDSSEKGKIMWARVKGKTENALLKLPFKKVYNFRLRFMKPTAGQNNIKGYYKFINALYPLLHFLFPKQLSSLSEVGLAMRNSVLKDYPKKILEIKDIKLLAKL